MNYKGLLSMLLVVMIVLVGCGQKDGKVEIEEKESIKKNTVQVKTPPILKKDGVIQDGDKKAIGDAQKFITEKSTTAKGELGMNVVEIVGINGGKPSKYAFFQVLENRSNKELSNVEMYFTITNKLTQKVIYNNERVFLSKEDYGIVKPNEAIPFKVAIPDEEGITKEITPKDYTFEWNVTDAELK
ncbi:hypothetical protein HCB41_09585 [Listeria welshimeri]|nr:hypothetical protein [Listeria welshimeri]